MTLKIVTDEGLHGLGDATLNGREMAVVAYLEDHVIPCLIGRDPHRIEDIWQYLYKGAYWRRGPVTMTAIAAVDTALWDIKAKAAGLPLYQLLGGERAATRVMVYGHANGATSPRRSMRSRPHGAGLQGDPRPVRRARSRQGLRRARAARSTSRPKRASRPRPSGHREVPRSRPEALRAAAREIRLRHHLLHDVHHRLTPIEAARLGKALEPLRLFWMEDPTPAENQEASA